MAGLPAVNREMIQILSRGEQALIRLDLVECSRRRGTRPSVESATAKWQSIGHQCRPGDPRHPDADAGRDLGAAEQIAGKRIALIDPPDLRSASVSWGNGPATPAPWRTWSSRSKNDLVRRSRWRGRGSRRLQPSTARCAPRGAPGDLQGGGPGEGRLHGAAGPHRGRGVPLDPEDRDEPAHVDEGWPSRSSRRIPARSPPPPDGSPSGRPVVPNGFRREAERSASSDVNRPASRSRRT